MYRVERLEGAEWRILMQCDFEDTEQFEIIAQNPIYRIMKDEEDITTKFVNNPEQRVNLNSPKVNKSTVTPNITSKSSAMKPAAYRALDDAAKKKLIDKAAELKAAKYKRADIMAELNVTESTYDLIRSESSSNAPKEEPAQPVIASKPEPQPQSKISPQHTTTAVRRGLLNRR